MGNETSQQDRSQSPSVIIITPEQVVIDRDNVSKLPDYTNRLKEIKERLLELEKKQCETVLKFKDTYLGDPTIIQALLPIMTEMEILSIEKKIIKTNTSSLEERVKLSSKLYEMAVMYKERVYAFHNLTAECNCDNCSNKNKPTKTDNSTNKKHQDQ